MKLHLKKDSRGIAHMAVIAGIVVIAVIGGVGFVVHNRQSSTATVSNKEAQDACNKELKDSDFCKFASSWTGLSNYKAVTTATQKDGTTSKITLQAENKDKTQMTVSQNGTDISDYITISGSTYVKDFSDNKWTKYTTDATYKTEDVKDDVKIDFTQTTVAEKDRTQYKKIGKEACGKLTCFKYQIIDPKDTATEQFVWFDTKDHLLRRWTSKNVDGSSDTTFSYDTVKISEPSPIKEAASLNTTNPSQADIDKALQALQAAGGNDSSATTPDDNPDQ